MDTANPRGQAPEGIMHRAAPGPASTEDGAYAPADLRRRRLLRGLAALPAVYTLGSGAQGANVSSHQCVAHNPLEDPTAVGQLHVPNAADAQGRMGVCAGGYQRGVPTYQGFAVDTSDPADGLPDYYLFSYDPDPTATEFYDQNGALWTRDLATGQFKQQGTNTAYEGTPTDVLPAVYVDNEGGVAFFPDKDTLNGATALGCSCWSSFAPGTLNPFT